MALTYWNQNGKYQKEYQEIHATHIPSEGDCSTDEGNLLRCVSNFYYRRFNDGDRTMSDAPTFNKLARKFEKHGLAKVRLGRNVADHELDDIIDKVMEFLIPRMLRKQVTIEAKLYITMEVPRTMSDADCANLLRYDSVAEITSPKSEVVVEVSDILDVSVNSTTDI